MQNHGYPAIFSWNTNFFFKMPGNHVTIMKEIKKVQKEIDNLEWKIRNEVVDDDAVNALKKKITELKEVITAVLETLPSMK